MKNNVIIRKEKISIQTSSEHLALKLRSLINDTVQYELLDVYDSVFNSKEFSGIENVFINKISLHIGKCSENEFESRFASLVKNALINHLHQPQNEIEVMQLQEVKNLTVNRPGNYVSAFLYFLEHGVFPWWFTSVMYQSPSAILEQLNEPEWQEVISGIIIIQRDNPAAAAFIRRRFINSVGAANYRKVISLLIPNNDSSSENIQQFSLDVLVRLITSQFGLETKNIESNLLEFLLCRVGDSKQDLLGSFAATFFTRFGRQVNISDLDTLEELPRRIRDYINDIINQPIDFELQQQLPVDEPTPVGDNVDEEIIYISNAGLVILHPFLMPLFRELDLLKNDDSFISGQSAIRAACVLNYLQTGKVHFEEQFMAFNKILCGMQVQAALPEKLLLSEAERSECDILLESVITNWDALKGSSIEAVRETFLTRNGKLSLKAGNYLLQVERQAVDVLMDRLPWGISTIKLPWMQQLIFTEW